MKFETLFAKHLRPTGKSWRVVVKDVKGLDMYFRSRKEARQYKKLLSDSSRQLESSIMLVEVDEGYITEIQKS